MLWSRVIIYLTNTLNLLISLPPLYLLGKPQEKPFTYFVLVFKLNAYIQLPKWADWSRFSDPSATSSTLLHFSRQFAFPHIPFSLLRFLLTLRWWPHLMLHRENKIIGSTISSSHCQLYQLIYIFSHILPSLLLKRKSISSLISIHPLQEIDPEDRK